MTDTLARRQGTVVRKFGDLPPAQTGMTAERALELAGVDATEFALLASTTFKEATTLEELVTRIATTRRRGLDGLMGQVYYERFGGDSSGPSLHVAIDGLRAIAARTGRYAGSSEPRYSDTWDMPIAEDRDGKVPKTKPVVGRCSVTVWGIVQGRSCAFEGVAYMEESYPGAGGRGRMWRARPRGMLAIAAERQALRKAFPSETSGIGDVDEAPDPEPEPEPRQTVVESARRVVEHAATYDRILGTEDDPSPTKRQRPLEDLVERYQARLQEALGSGLISEEDLPQWVLSEDATREVVLEYGLRIADLQRLAAEKPPDVTTRSALGQQLADLVEEAARLEVEFDDCKVGLPAPREQVIRAIEKLQDRVEAKKRQLAGLETQGDAQTQQALV